MKREASQAPKVGGWNLFFGLLPSNVYPRGQDKQGSGVLPAAAAPPLTPPSNQRMSQGFQHTSRLISRGGGVTFLEHARSLERACKDLWIFNLFKYVSFQILHVFKKERKIIFKTNWNLARPDPATFFFSFYFFFFQGGGGEGSISFKFTVSEGGALGAVPPDIFLLPYGPTFIPNIVFCWFRRFFKIWKDFVGFGGLGA